MTFLNAILALGTLAFTVPLVIHLLYRSKYRIVDWGAMHLLEFNQQVNSRSYEWNNWLLLLLRCLIPTFLALAMARPLMQSWFSAGAGEPIAMAVLLDDSPSMQTKQIHGETRWISALSELERVVDSLPGGSQVAVVLGGRVPLIQAPESLQEMIEEWKKSPSISGQLDTEESMRKALEWLSQANSVRRQILVLSDFQTNDWNRSATQHEGIASLLDQQVVRPKVAWLQIDNRGEGDPEPSNLSIEKLGLSSQWVTQNQDLFILTTVRNHSSSERGNVTLRVDVDQSEVDRQSFRVPAGSSVQIRSLWRAKQTGTSLVRAELIDTDDLKTDNEAWLPVPVQKSVSVLLVEGDPRGGPMESETDFLRVALSPFAMTNQTLADFFNSKVVLTHSWNEETLKGVKVVALCNTAGISEHQQNLLRRFVEQGGGLVIFPGDRIQPEEWNPWKSITEGGLRIARFQKRRINLENAAKAEASKADSSASDATKSEVRNTDHSVFIDVDSFRVNRLTELSRGAKETLRDIQVRALLPIEPESDERIDVIASFSDSLPWFLRCRLGKGIILVSALSCDEGDSNLPSKPVYVPLMQRLFHIAAQSAQPDFELAAGQAWVPELVSDWSDAERERATLAIQGPGQKMETTQTRQWDRTRQIGLYEARWTSGDKIAKTFVSIKPTLDTKNTESDSTLRRLPPSDLEPSQKAWGAGKYANAQEMINATRNDWSGREIGHWFWFLTVLCFLGEMFVEQSFLVRKKGTNRIPSGEIKMPVPQGGT